MPYRIGNRNYWMIWEIAERWDVSPQTVRHYVVWDDFKHVYKLPITPTGSKWVYVIPASEVRRVGRLFGYE